jgi:hypothetical protein
LRLLLSNQLPSVPDSYVMTEVCSSSSSGGNGNGNGNGNQCDM